ncbi:hypothetical protein FJY94_07655, partial [Candidatus Kaiserbacteria bacterium]|nr:hypothetical protein [Candidatus Kaiserbacteria bacterium]
MTLFIITVTDESAYVSQDTFCSHLLPNTAPLDDFATVNLADDQSNARATTGIASPTDKLKTFTSKIVAVPHMHMVMGGAGHHELIMAWAQVLTVIPARDLVELDSILPDAIKH